MPILPREIDLFPSDLLDRTDVGTEPDRRWWAVYTRSRREKDLMRRLKTMDLAFYGPTVAKSQRSPSGRVRTSFMPVFANYVFVYGDAGARHRTLETNCVSSCIEVADGDFTRAEPRPRGHEGSYFGDHFAEGSWEWGCHARRVWRSTANRPATERAGTWQAVSALHHGARSSRIAAIRAIRSPISGAPKS